MTDPAPPLTSPASAGEAGMAGTDPAAAALRQRFLLGMSHAACTVNVVTTDGSAGRHGVTVSAMVSVSADTPNPTLLVCIHQLSPVADALLQNGVFCVNVLREDQAYISDTFAGRAGVHGTSKFDCAEWATQVTGAPRVADALVAFDCRVTGSDRIGSHFVVLGSVEDIFVSGTGVPLIYANRAYGVPQRFYPRQAPVSAADVGAAGNDAAGTAAAAPPESLALGCFAIFAPYIVPALIARLTKLHPRIALTLIEADQARLIAGLRRDEVEVALLYDFDLGADIHVEELADLIPYVLLPEGHPLAGLPQLTLEALAPEPLVLLDIDPSRDYFLSLFRDQGLEPRVAYRSRSLEMVRGLVGHGLGYALLATKPANNMSYDGRALVARPLVGKMRHSRLVLATLEGHSPSLLAQEFAAHCRALLRIAEHF